MTAILADIGGTNTRVALADAGIASVEGACVAAAGPVRQGVAEMTNLSWIIDHAMLTRATGASKVRS